MGGYGMAVRIDHGLGVTTVYGHMSRVLTEVGAEVVAGEQIGAIGCTGRCTGPHLHFEIRSDDVAHDPATALPVRDDAGAPSTGEEVVAATN